MKFLISNYFFPDQLIQNSISGDRVLKFIQDSYPDFNQGKLPKSYLEVLQNDENGNSLKLVCKDASGFGQMILEVYVNEIRVLRFPYNMNLEN